MIEDSISRIRRLQAEVLALACDADAQNWHRSPGSTSWTEPRILAGIQARATRSRVRVDRDGQVWFTPEVKA